MKYIIILLLLLMGLLFTAHIIDKQRHIIATMKAMKAQDKTVISLQTQLIRDQWLTIQQTKHAVEECVNARSE